MDNIAYQLSEELVSYRRNKASNEIKLGKMLWQMENEEEDGQKLFEHLGFDTFRHYLISPIDGGGIDISPYKARKLINIYKKIVKDTDLQDMSLLDGIEIDKLNLIKDIVNKDNIEEWLRKANTLTLDHFRIEVAEAKAVEKPTEQYVRNIPWDIYPSLLRELIKQLVNIIKEGNCNNANVVDDLALSLVKSGEVTLARICNTLSSLKIRLKKDLELGKYFWEINKNDCISNQSK